jgi:hypothetical protein
MALNADGVRSISRLLWQVLPQQVLSPQKLLVAGPQSAMDTETEDLLHRLVTENTWPRPRSARLRPQASGRVMLKQDDEAYGHAHWWLPDLQLPHAPPPADPHGPHELPQQNQLISPVAGVIGVTSIDPIDFPNSVNVNTQFGYCDRAPPSMVRRHARSTNFAK